MTDTTHNRIWLEIEYSEDANILQGRIDRLNAICGATGLKGHSQYFFQYEKRGFNRLGFRIAEDGRYLECEDFGHWFALDNQSERGAN